MENGRLDMGVTFFEGVGRRLDQGVERERMGRRGVEAIESFSKLAAKLEMLREFMVVVDCSTELWGSVKLQCLSVLKSVND